MPRLARLSAVRPSMAVVQVLLIRSFPWLFVFDPSTQRSTTSSPRPPQHLVVGAGLLAEMLADGTDREAVAKRMREAEHAADETTHAIVRRVNSTFVTPFDREDIYTLASGLDDVMDMMDEAVDLVLLYEVAHLPAELSSRSRCCSAAPS